MQVEVYLSESCATSLHMAPYDAFLVKVGTEIRFQVSTGISLL